MTEPRKVANAPVKPLLIFDGECHFCRQWIERWKQRDREGKLREYCQVAIYVLEMKLRKRND